MSKLKIAMVAGGLAFLMNNLSILLFFGGIFLGQWLLYPAIYFTPDIEAGYLFDFVFYMFGLLQFFIVFFIFLWVVVRLRHGKHSA